MTGKLTGTQMTALVSKVSDPRAGAIPTNASPQQLAFINEILPYVLRESARTGIPPQVFIVQAGNETGWGTSAWWRQSHNPAGIGVTGAAGAGHGYADIGSAFTDYANKLMGHGEAGQEQFVRDVQAGAPAIVLLQDLEASPWAAGHYGGTGLENIYHSLYGGATNPATQGTGAPGGPVNFTDAPLGLGHLPLIGGALNAAWAGLSLPAQLAGVGLSIFQNWRFVVEVIAGVAMIWVGVLLILHDTGVDKKAMQVAGVAAIA